MYSCPHRARVYSHDCGGFASVCNSNVLIYWPHGFGDWVQLGYILPLLDRTNRYWITRFGDDNTSVMEEHDFMRPIHLGVNSTHCGDGETYRNRHFGLDYEHVDGAEKELQLPPTLHEECIRHSIDTVLWTAFPEILGHAEFPYHSKPRKLLSYLATADALRDIDLGRSLTNSISFNVAPWVVRWVEARLKNFAGFGKRKLCLIGRNGYTSIGKNWGHLFREDLPSGHRHEGEECRDFMRLMLRRDPHWMFLIMEDRLFEGEHTIRSSELQAYSYAELFGTPGTSSVPFGLVMKVLVNLAEISIGVPAGPYHLSMAKPELPTIGLWIEHLPSWYDEPKPNSLHIVSRNVRDRGFDQRPGSFSDRGDLHFRTTWVDSRVITSEHVMNAVEQLV